jgi:N-acetylglutamate synthase-like GNAT family acetyltransferase
MRIEVYNKDFQQEVIELALNIQQNEFNVPVTINDQPDLLNIEKFYCRKDGNFWIAVDDKKVVGTIALIDIENKQVCLRKMFVHKDYRGKEKGVGQLLLDTCVAWCKQNNIQEVYLGTIDIMEAAKKFYLRNRFIEINKEMLPSHFPVMQVDNRFYKLVISES